MSLHTPPPRSVFRELNYTPPERDRGEKNRHIDREKLRQRQGDGAKLEFVLPCVASNVEIQFFWLCKGKNIRTINSDGAEAGTGQELLSCVLLWQQLNQLMM